MGRRSKKGRKEDICQGIGAAEVSSGIPIPVLVPREAKKRARYHVRNEMLCVFALSLSLSILLPPPPPLSVFPPSPGLAREPSHSQKTQNAGPKRERAEARGDVSVCVLWRQAVHRLYSCRSSSRYTEGWMRSFVTSLLERYRVALSATPRRATILMITMKEQFVTELYNYINANFSNSCMLFHTRIKYLASKNIRAPFPSFPPFCRTIVVCSLTR